MMLVTVARMDTILFCAWIANYKTIQHTVGVYNRYYTGHVELDESHEYHIGDQSVLGTKMIMAKSAIELHLTYSYFI